MTIDCDFYRLASDVGEFSLQMFGGQRGDAAARKCLNEATEFAEQPTVEEAADVLITLLSWCAQTGRPASELVVAAENKMRRNRNRTWALSGDGTYQHVGGDQ